MRERLPAHIGYKLSTRITPARAGKTKRRKGQRCRIWDHPRSCGKDSARMRTNGRQTGSPPLVRERRFIIQLTITDIRITPARAGKTCREWYSGPRYGDHPRSCEKDKEVPDWILNLLGSPPLVRERLIAILVIYPHQGITPARAGKTNRDKIVSRRVKDHPRSCGKDSNGFLYLRHFALAGIQNLFNFFAEYLSTKKHKARFAKIQLSQPPI